MNAVNAIANMLNSTHHAVCSSSRAMVNAMDELTKLKNQVLYFSNVFLHMCKWKTHYELVMRLRASVRMLVRFRRKNGLNQIWRNGFLSPNSSEILILFVGNNIYQ